jgi:uncharacterized protein YndB with AHSA1/START domain
MEPTVTRSGRELKIARLINAPRELVFEAWTDPKHLAHWWGPNGFTITSEQMDVKAGGSWTFMMHGPDGRDWPNKIVYLEVVRPEKLVYKHAGDGDTAHVSFHVTVTFEKEGNQTRLTMHSVHTSAEELERLNREVGAIEGGKQTINRLAEYLLQIQ